jgi:predicted Zn finger-like uncharacterized protein
MLFTRCPECATAFRVTDEALKKASGQVRCGRCASVFNALAEQIRADAEPTSSPNDETAAETVAAAAASASQAPHGAEPDVSTGAVSERAVAAPPDEPMDTAAASIDASSVADVVAETELAATAEIDMFSAEQVEEVLATVETASSLDRATPWSSPTASLRRSRWWTGAAAAAVLLLSLQVVNHYRATLAGQPTVGRWIQQAYGLIGVAVTPRWDVRQYEILDWVATAEPNTRGVGSLTISARIQNRGPERQPYPDVQLRLKDRWEEAVGSRMFTPDEYLARDTPHDRLMSPGETARAEMEVVDPGPDAYGFELDVCIEVEANKLTCRNDKVFR